MVLLPTTDASLPHWRRSPPGRVIYPDVPRLCANCEKFTTWEPLVPFAAVTAPVKAPVLENVAAPVTPKVPATVVLPLAAVTLNLFVFTARLPVIPAVLENVAAPVTPSVPATVVLPLADATWNLFVLILNCPARLSVLESVATPVTLRVVPTVVAPELVSVAADTAPDAVTFVAPVIALLFMFRLPVIGVCPSLATEVVSVEAISEKSLLTAAGSMTVPLMKAASGRLYVPLPLRGTGEILYVCGMSNKRAFANVVLACICGYPSFWFFSDEPNHKDLS